MAFERMPRYGGEPEIYFTTVLCGCYGPGTEWHASACALRCQSLGPTLAESGMHGAKPSNYRPQCILGYRHSGPHRTPGSLRW